MSASLPADPDPLARASGWYFRNHRRALPLFIPARSASEGVCASARRNTGADVLRDLQVVRVTPGRSGPLACASGWYSETHRDWSALIQPEAQARGSARAARRNTGADVLRDLQVVRVTPGRSGPPRSRFGLVFPDPTTTGASQHQKRKRGGPRKSSQEHRRRRIERPPGCPRHSRPIRTPSLALRAGIPRPDQRLVERIQPEAQARGSARELAGSTGADVLRDLQVVRVTPGRSGPPRSRFGLVFPKPPAGSSALHTSPKRKRGGPRESSQEDRRRRIERPPGCPRHSRPIRTPSLALRAGISETRPADCVRSSYQPEAQARGSARELAGRQAPTY